MIKKLLKQIIRFGARKEHWVRVIMNRETMNLLNNLDTADFKVLEISGSAWKNKIPYKSYTNVKYPEFDLCETALKEEFDLIIAEQVFEHLLWPYRAGKNVYQMLKPGAYFLISTPFLLRVHPSPHDCSRWTETGLKHLLAECGFPIDEINTGSWGNKDCIKKNLGKWRNYNPIFHSLKNESFYPAVVWALARKNIQAP